MKDQGPKGSPNVRINNQEDKQNERFLIANNQGWNYF